MGNVAVCLPVFAMLIVHKFLQYKALGADLRCVIVGHTCRNYRCHVMDYIYDTELVNNE